jgi:hypothetical protein
MTASQAQAALALVAQDIIEKREAAAKAAMARNLKAVRLRGSGQWAR